MTLRLRAEYINGSLKLLEENILDLFDRLRKSVPEDEWERLPADGAMNLKHYLYGHPKVNDQ